MKKLSPMFKCKAFSVDLLIHNGKIFRSKARATSLLVMSLFLLLFPIMVAAQAVSGVTGIVTDPGGAVVPGVQVVLVDTKTSRELTTTTNEEGFYVFSNLQPGGGYRLTFTGQGFQTLVLNDLQLGIGRTETHNAQLSAGQVTGIVEVTTSNEATLNTTDASIGNVISERQIRELPIQFRDNPAALLGLQPGVIGNNVGTGAVNRVGSVTGSRADQGNITVDGIDSNDVTTGQAFVTIGNLPIDSVQEFRAVSTNPNASEGRSSGGQIQLATRSGTNEFHGSLREYWRGEQFAANTFFNNRNRVERPALQRHQFGGSLSGPLYLPGINEGGPIWMGGKDRLFFFFDYEGRRDDSESAQSRVVPLQHFREGRIGYILATSTTTGAACPSTARLDTRPDCIGFLTQAQSAALDPRGIGFNQALLNFINQRYPLPNDLSGGNGINTGLFRFNAPVIVNNNTYTTRIDGNINDNQRAYGRLTLTRNSQTNGLELFPGDGDSQVLNDKSYQLVGNHTWAINSSLTNQVTVGVSRQLWDFPVAASAAYPNSFTFAVVQSPFAGISYQDRDVIVPTLRDDATWIRGSHTFQFGVSYKPNQQNTTLINDFNFPSVGLGGNLSNLAVPTGTAPIRPSNLLNNTTALSNFDAAYVFALGRLSTISTRYVFDTSGAVQPLGTGRKRNWSYNEYELYAQDNWKIRSDLTLNLGLRWQFYPAPFDKNGFQSGNDVDFDELVAARIANNAAGISGNAAEPLLRYTLIGQENDARALYDSDYNNFSPRIGFAYSPSFKNGLMGAIFGDRKTSLRGGYSLVYDRVGGALTFIQDQNSYIFDQVSTVNFGASTNARTNLLNDPRFTGINSVPVQPAPTTITIPFTPNINATGRPVGLELGRSNYTVVQNFEIPYSHQWSFGVQRDLPGNMLLDVSYVGRRARKQFALADASQVMNFRDPASGQLLFDAFNAVQTQLQAGTTAANLTPQPWLENQLTAGIRTLRGANFNCGSFGLGSNCTQLVANFQPTMVLTGNTADLVQILAQNLLLSPNVGMSSQFAVNSYVTNLGEGQYDGMLVTLRKRFSQGFQFDVNYTWAHAIDNNSSVANVTNSTTSAYICNILDVKSCRGDSDFDIRHVANINGIWDIPFGRGRALGKDMPKWLDAVIGGWTLAGIFSARSGLPATSTTGAFTLGFFQDNPAVLIGDRSAFRADIRDEGTGIQYFADPAAALAALRYPRHGEAGSRNIFRSEGFWTLDAVVSKRFNMPWAEKHRLTFRAEAYNLTNSTFFAPPSTAFNSPGTFGRITAVQSAPRVIQFALRYDF